MGTITTGTGLMSGLNIQEIVTKLMAIEQKPLDLLKTRINTTTNQQNAYNLLSASLLAVKSAVARLAQSSSYQSRQAASSNEDILTAAADDKTPLDTYRFQVASLVTTNQLVSGGFADRNRTPAGAGVIRFELGEANVQPPTALADLNGFNGIQRGIVRITDRSGASTDIDLRTATTLDEVIEAINSQTTVRVRASTRGDSLVLSDTTGLGAGNLSVVDLTGSAASDLGIAGTSATGQMIGSDLVYLTASTRLARLNDGMGVRANGALDDVRFTLKDGSQIDVNLSGLLRFSTRLEELNDGRGVRLGTIKVTNRAGTATQIDLSGSQTIQEIVDKINGSGASVTASLAGSKLTITDSTGGTGNLKIEDVSGYAAADLGITCDAAGNLSGVAVYRVDTIGAVLRAIQYATGNNGALTASLSADGNGITLQDNTTGIDAPMVEALNGSKALEDLGLTAGFTGDTLQSRPLVGGLNTVLLSSLNGGSGVDTSALTITRQVGASTTTETIDVSAARTLQDVIDAINAKTDGGGAPMFAAEIADGGTGITIRDIAGGQLTAVAGATADALHLSVSNGQAVGGDLQLRYINENTSLAELNGGAGVAYGSTLRITASDGSTKTLKLSETTHKTVGDVIRAINSLDIHVTASLNATGDGIQLTDTAGGAGTLKVAEEGSGTAAADLGILGTATGTVLAGSFAKTVQIDGDDTLDDVVTKINSAHAGVKASIINDGTSSAPYRLVLTSGTTGSKGQINYSSTSAGLTFNTLSQGKDAKIVVGDLNSPGAVVVTSSSNTVKDVVEGLTLTLKGTSNQPVEVSVTRNVDQVVSDVKSMADAFNATVDRISEFTKYVPDTEERGVLLGDSTVLQVRDRLYSTLTARITTSGMTLTRLSQIGLTMGSGAHLEFDEDAFRKAFEADPEAVEKLLTLTTTDSKNKTVNVGFAAKLDALLEDLTTSGTGTIAQQVNTLQDRVDLYTNRATEMQKLLDLKQNRLYGQFQAMEAALAQLQSQQSALSALANAASAASSSLSSLG